MAHGLTSLIGEAEVCRRYAHTRLPFAFRPDAIAMREMEAWLQCVVTEWLHFLVSFDFHDDSIEFIELIASVIVAEPGGYLTIICLFVESAQCIFPGNVQIAQHYRSPRSDSLARDHLGCETNNNKQAPSIQSYLWTHCQSEAEGFQANIGFHDASP